jgi:hypothetical protein
MGMKSEHEDRQRRSNVRTNVRENPMIDVDSNPVVKAHKAGYAAGLSGDVEAWDTPTFGGHVLAQEAWRVGFRVGQGVRSRAKVSIR